MYTLALEYKHTGPEIGVIGVREYREIGSYQG